MAPSSLRSLISSPGHANMLRFFPGGRRPCWRRPSCEALFLRRVTPTCSGFSRVAPGRVGAFLPAKPYFFAGSRQHAPVFPGRSPVALAPSSLQDLISSPSHANMARIFPASRRPCWRRPPCEALFLRRATPTCSGFSHIADGFVGAFLSAKPYFFAGSRQHAPVFPGRSPAALAPSFLRSLISSPSHANMARIFPASRRPCWRLLPCEALFLRRVTPTCSGFSRAVGAHVGAGLPARPYSFVESRQHGLDFPGFPPPMLAPSFLRGLISSPSHANILRFFPGGRRPRWRRPSCEALFLRRVTPTCSGFSRAVAGFVGAFLSAKPYFFAGSRQHVPHFPSFSFSYSAST